MTTFSIIDAPPANEPYYESRQAVGLRFSFLNQKGPNLYQAMFAPVLCRDYLNDVLHAEYFNKRVGPVFGFSYNPAEQQIDRDKLRMGLFVDQQLFEVLREHLLAMLHSVEKQAGWQLSSGSFNEKTLQILVEGDSKWLRSTLHLSLYTLLCRLSGYGCSSVQQAKQLVRKQAVSDVLFFTHTNGNLEKALANLDAIYSLYGEHSLPPSGFSETAYIDDIHGVSGVLGVLAIDNLGWSHAGNKARKIVQEFLSKVA